MNEQLLEEIKNCPTLPSLPSVAMQVLELAQSADVDMGEIARTISRSRALIKILRTVNSSFYGRSQNVSTINQSLVILGLQSVKTLVLGFSLVNNLTHTKARGFQHMTYWKHSIYGATAARSLAQKLKMVQAEEAFLAALLADLEVLVLDMARPSDYGLICAKCRLHSELPAYERESLGATHAEVGGALAEMWKLPPLLCVPIASHHGAAGEITDPLLKGLAHVVELGGRCADIFVDEEPSVAIKEVHEALATHYQIEEAEANALLEEIGTRTKEVATLFEINIGAAGQYETIRAVREALETLALQSQIQTQQLERQNSELQEKVTRDGLTGLANRATFDEFFAERFTTAQSRKGELSLLMMDLDKFKSINDKHGHQAGDAVLQAVGKILISAARKQDLAARYGGEEMVLVLPATSRQVASAIAESIRRAIAAKPIPIGATSLPVTASIGVATFEPGCPFNAPAHLIKAADLAVYNAKHSGRNCVKVLAIKSKAA